MLIECASQERTYMRYYGLLGQRFCLLKREYQEVARRMSSSLCRLAARCTSAGNFDASCYVTYYSSCAWSCVAVCTVLPLQCFDLCFVEQYETIHRLETNKLVRGCC